MNPGLLLLPIFELTRVAVMQPNIDSVAVAGSWNGWAPQALVQSPDTAGLWETEVELSPGTYEYRFLVNGHHWIKDPRNPRYGGSHSNSLLRVGYENHPRLAVDSPIPGEVLRVQPFGISLRYTPGADGAPPDPERCMLRLGARTFALHPSIRQGTLLRCTVDSLPEGEIMLHASARSMAGHGDSLSYMLLVNRRNQSPKARTAGLVFARPKWPIELDGGGSYDPDGEALQEFSWTVVEHPSLPILDGADTPYPKIVPKPGTTRLVLRVSDGQLWSEPDTLLLVCGGPPVTPVHFVLAPEESTWDSLQILEACVLGSWNGWRMGRNPLTCRPDGVWEAWLAPDPGIHEYQFCINRTLRIRDAARHVLGKNSLLVVRDVGSAPAFDFIQEPNGRWRMETPSNVEASANVFVWPGSMEPIPMDPATALSFPTSEEPITRMLVSSRDPAHYFPPLSLLESRTEGDSTLLTVLHEPPSWARDAIICWVPRQRFLKTITSLSTLAMFGVNTIWLPPILPGPLPHGYGPTDHFSLDPSLGTMDDLRRLIHQAHGLGQKVILDFVANHTSDQAPRYLSAGDPRSTWHRWYRWSQGRSPAHWFHWDQLVNLDLTNPAARHHLLACAAYWQQMGFDGYRLDLAWALPLPFIHQLREQSRIHRPDFLLLGEVIPREPRFHYAALDMSYDTDFYGLMLDLLKGAVLTEEIPAHWARITSRYPRESVGMTYLENHDTPPLARQFSLEQCAVAGLWLFTWPGAPMILQPGHAQGAEELPIQTMENLIHLRRSFLALRGATVQWLHAAQGVLVYLRPGDAPCVVVLNFASQVRQITLNDLPGSNNRANLWEPVMHVGIPPALNQRGSMLRIQCPGLSGVVLVPEEFSAHFSRHGNSTR